MDVFARQFDFGWTEAAIVTTLSAWLGLSILSAYRDRNGPPSVPYYIPIIGHTYQLQARPKEFLQECREKYGNVFSVNYLGKRVIVFSNEEATEMMKIQDLTISDGRNELFLIMDALGDWHGAPGIPEKIISSREVIQEKLGPMLKRVLPDVLVRIHQAIDDQLAKGEGGRRALDIKTFFSDIVVYTVSILLVGHDLAKDEVLAEVMAGYFSDVENMMILGLPWHMVPIIGSKIAQTIVRKTTPSIKIRKTIEQRIKATVEARCKLDPQDRPTPNNFLDALIDEGYPLDSIANLLMFLIFASISTTTGTCQRLLSDLLAHPQFFDRLKQEQAEVLASAPIDPATGMPALNRENLDKMVHLNSAIRETLRHRAYVLEQWRKIPTQRTLNNGMVLPAGSLLAVDMPSIHFNPQVYGALDDEETDPYLYRPSRFVASRTSATRVNFSFMGFGAGKHACPGRFFAVQEVTAIMSVLLRTCNVTTVSGKPGPFHTTGFSHPDMEAVFTRI